MKALEAFSNLIALIGLFVVLSILGTIVVMYWYIGALIAIIAALVIWVQTRKESK